MEQQTNLLTRLKTKLPNNLIIVGSKYSGKKTLMLEIAPDFYYVDNNVEAIRSLDPKGNYVFIDIDDWSSACFGAMLKLLEENNNYNIIII